MTLLSTSNTLFSYFNHSLITPMSKVDSNSIPALSIPLRVAMFTKVFLLIS